MLILVLRGSCGRRFVDNCCAVSAVRPMIQEGAGALFHLGGGDFVGGGLVELLRAHEVELLAGGARGWGQVLLVRLVRLRGSCVLLGAIVMCQILHARSFLLCVRSSAAATTMLPRVVSASQVMSSRPRRRCLCKRARPHATIVNPATTVMIITLIIGPTVAALKAVVLSHKVVGQTTIDLSLVFFEGVSAGAAHCSDRLMGRLIVVTLLPSYRSCC